VQHLNCSTFKQTVFQTLPFIRAFLKFTRHNSQNTALICAASKGHLHICQFLVQSGADIEARSWWVGGDVLLSSNIVHTFAAFIIVTTNIITTTTLTTTTINTTTLTATAVTTPTPPPPPPPP
jgi:ankyrin repeat protein